MNGVTGFRASPQQAACWSLQEGATHPYWSTLQLQVGGTLDADVLATRLQGLAENEEILRTRPHAVPGMREPIQHIVDSMRLPLRHEDLRDLALDAAEAHLQRQLEALPDDGAPLLAILSRIGEYTHVLTLRANAANADLASLHLLASRLLAAGEARSAGAEDALQYADYAEWKAGLLEDEAGAGFWRQQAASAAPLALPGLEADAQPAAFAPRLRALALPPSAAILRQCEASGCTPAEWFAAAWAVLLARLSGQPQIDIALVDAGRGEGLDNALGLYEQALPLRCSVDLEQTFTAQLAGIGAALVQAQGWRDYHGNAQPLEHAFAWHAVPFLASAQGPSLRHQQCIAQRFSLRLEAWQEGTSLACRLAYDAARWSEPALACVAEQCESLLAALAADPALPAGAYPLHGPVQRALFTEAPPPAIDDATVVQLIERRAAATPDAPALADTAATIDYAEMNRRANRLAHKLLRLGVTPGEVVGIALPRSIDMVVSMLAVLKAGAAYLPLDPSYPAERLDFMVRDSGARHVIGRDLRPDTLWDAARDGADDGNPPALDALGQPAYLIYTSGSTGEPKAVEVGHRSLSHSTQVRMAFYGTPVRAFLLLSSFSFDSSVAGIFWTLCQGGKLVLPAPGEELALDALCALVERHRVSHSLSLPSLYGALLDHAPEGLLHCLDTWVVAGEACAPALVARHHAALPGVRLVNEYGPTEGGVWATADVLTPQAGPVSIGRAIPGMVLELVNQHGTPCAVGEPGEICLAGPQLANGYRGRPEQSAVAFRPLPGIAGGQRVYRSGDLARRDAQGKLLLIGRRDQQVKIRGHRVELAEIERHLQSHPEIGETAIVAQDQAAGKRLLAYYTARHAHAPDEAALRTFLDARLPAYMMPAVFVALDAIPRTPNGKRDLNALPDPAALRGRTDDYLAPRTQLERELADICAAVLRVPRFGVRDNFFHAGGDSILSLQVVTRANQAGITLSTRQVFELQTVEAMAAAAGRTQAASFRADVGWLQSWGGREEIAAFALAQEWGRIDAGETLAIALARVLPTSAGAQPVTLARLHNTGNGQYLTRHLLPAPAADFDAAMREAKTALRTELAVQGPAHAVLACRQAADDGDKLAQDLPADAPLRLAATLLPHALTLGFSADSAHYTEEALQQLSAALVRELAAIARQFQALPATAPRAQDFAALALDQDALDALLSELDATN